MEDNNSFLRFLIDEEIYIIPEQPEGKPLPEGGNPVPAGERAATPHVKAKDKLTLDNVTALMLDYSSEAEVPEEIEELLSKIQGSVDLEDHQVNRLYRDRSDQMYPDHFKNCKIVAFVEKIPVNLTACFDPQPYRLKSDGTNHFLFCDALDKIHKDRNLKMKLWEQLKKLYAIST